MKITTLCLIPALAACTHDLSLFEQADVQTARPLDLLYVIDNSAAHDSYDAMASQLAGLERQLADVDGQLPSLHVGVVTTDLGIHGTLDSSPFSPAAGCAGDGDAGKLVTFGAGLSFGNFLIDERGGNGARIRNFSSSLAATLAALTNPPRAAMTGCPYPQPLEAMRRALDPANNPGFLRPEARLSIVFLTPQDDCSLAHGALLNPNDPTLGAMTSFRCTAQAVICDDDVTAPGAHKSCRPNPHSPYLVDVSEYRTFLAALKNDPHDIQVSVVGGPREPVTVASGPTLQASCQGPNGSAAPAIRLGALVDAFGGALVNACTQADAYAQITAPISNRAQTCFPHLRGTDGDHCTVDEIVAGNATSLPHCGDAAATGPCWRTQIDAAACPVGDHVSISVARGGAPAPVGAHIAATCFAD